MRGAALVVVTVGSVLLGFVVGFFTLFAYLFTDGPQSLVAGQRLVADVIVLAVYGLVSFGLAAWTGRGGAWWLAAFTGPGLLLAGVYAVREVASVPLALVECALAAAATLGGSWAGRRVWASRHVAADRHS